MLIVVIACAVGGAILVVCIIGTAVVAYRLAG